MPCHPPDSQFYAFDSPISMPDQTIPCPDGHNRPIDQPTDHPQPLSPILHRRHSSFGRLMLASQQPFHVLKVLSHALRVWMFVPE